jgi:hypothetical protein
MTLVKSLHSDDRDVILNTLTCKASVGIKLSALQVLLAYILVQFMYVHVTHVMSHVVGAYVDVPNS